MKSRYQALSGIDVWDRFENKKNINKGRVEVIQEDAESSSSVVWIFSTEFYRYIFSNLLFAPP